MKTKTKITKSEKEDLKKLQNKFYFRFPNKYRFIIWHDTIEQAKKDKGFKKLSEKEKQQVARYYELSDKEMNSLTKKQLAEISKDAQEFLSQDDWKYEVGAEKRRNEFLKTLANLPAVKKALRKQK